MKSYLSASRPLEWYLDREADRVSTGKTRLLEMEHILTVLGLAEQIESVLR
jgi:hypothetical protein